MDRVNRTEVAALPHRGAPPSGVDLTPLTIPAPSAVSTRGFGPYVPSTAAAPCATPQSAQANAFTGEALALVDAVAGGRRRGGIGNAVTTILFGVLWLALSLG